MWSRLVGGIVGMAIAGLAVFALWSYSIVPLLTYDYEGYYLGQTKSGVYTRGFTLEESIGQTIDKKMFTANHIVMLPAVDTDSNVDVRCTWIYDDIQYMSGLASPIWERLYRINLESMYNKSITFNSYLSASFNNTGRPGQGTYNWYTLESMSPFDSIVNGAHGQSNLLFYLGDRPERDFRWPVYPSVP